MQLEKKRELAARTLKIGKARIIFNKERLDEIKEAITKQDIRDLVTNKAILIAEIKGKRKKVKRKTRRRTGSIKKTVNIRKKNYMTITRKLRSYIFELKKQGALTVADYTKLRKEIRTNVFRSKAHLKERIVSLTKEKEEK